MFRVAGTLIIRPTRLDPKTLIIILEHFWKKDVQEVSIGALGMYVKGRPFEKSEVQRLIGATKGIELRDDWIVRKPS